MEVLDLTATEESSAVLLFYVIAGFVRLKSLLAARIYGALDTGWLALISFLS